MTSVNHTLAPVATVILHAYNFATNPRKPAQNLAFAYKTSRKFGLELRRWFEEGVRLSMSVMADAKFFGGATRDENTYIAITVTNRGTAATTITHMVLYNYPNRLSLFLSKCPRF